MVQRGVTTIPQILQPTATTAAKTSPRSGLAKKKYERFIRSTRQNAVLPKNNGAGGIG